MKKILFILALFLIAVSAYSQYTGGSGGGSSKINLHLMDINPVIQKLAPILDSTNHNFTVSAAITRYGTEAIKSHGFCWSCYNQFDELKAPDTNDSKIDLGSLCSADTFSTSMHSTWGSMYVFRSFVVTSNNIVYYGDMDTINVYGGGYRVTIKTRFNDIDTITQAPFLNYIPFSNFTLYKQNYTNQSWDTVKPSFRTDSVGEFKKLFTKMYCGTFNNYYISVDSSLLWIGKNSTVWTTPTGASITRTLTLEAHHETGVIGFDTLNYNSCNFMYRWHPIPGALQYKVYIIDGRANPGLLPTTDTCINLSGLLKPELPTVVDVRYTLDGVFWKRFTKNVPNEIITERFKFCKPTPISPANGAVDVPNGASLLCSTNQYATKYFFQVSSSPEFIALLLDTVTASNALPLSAVPNGSPTYYWRVKIGNDTTTYLDSSSNKPFKLTSPWSEVYYFSKRDLGPLVLNLDDFAISTCQSKYAVFASPTVSNGLPNTSYSYNWSPASLFVNPNSASPTTKTMNTVGQYPVTVTVTESGTGRSAVASCTLTVKPVPSVSVAPLVRRTISNPSVNLNANIINHSANIEGANDTLRWYDRFNSLIGVTTNPSLPLYYTASNARGIYRTYVIADNGDCESNPENVFIYYTLRREIDESGLVFADGAVLDAYPVPTDRKLNIDAVFADDCSIEISIVDILGSERMKFNRTGSELSEEIDLGDLPAGVYFLCAKSGGTILRKQIVKQ